MSLKNAVRSFLGIPLTLISFLFIGKIFWDQKDIIISSIQKAVPELLLIGIFFYIAFFLIKSFVWIKLLEVKGYEIDKKQTLFDYSISEVKRYIPGSVFAFVGRINTHKTLSAKDTLKGIAIEAVILTVSALLVSLPALIFISTKLLPLQNTILYAMLAISILGLVLLLVFKKKLVTTISKYFDLFVLTSCAWTLYSLGSLFILLSFTWANPENFVVISSIFAMSWLVGYLFFITPMGLGTRELAVTYSLGFFINPAIGVIVSIVSRLLMIVAEIIYLLILRIVKEQKVNSFLFRINPYFAIVITISILYFLLFTSLSFLRHDAFITGRFDLGNMDQTVWNTLNGRFFTLTNPDGTNIMSRLGVHSDVFLVFVTPLYFLWNSPKVLLMLQALSISIAGIYVYLISKKVTKNNLISLIFCVSFFANFWIQEQTLFDFHAVSVATLFLLAAFYYLISKKNLLFFIFLFLATTTKENIFLILCFFGIYFIKKKMYKTGVFLSLIGFFAFVFLIEFVIPNARGGQHFALEAYKYLGDSPLQVVKNSFTDPQIIIKQLVNFSTLDYFNTHLFSTGYLSLLSPFYLLFTLPEIAIYLLSSNFGYRSYQYHFGAAIVPFVYIASIYSAKKLAKKFNSKKVYKFTTYYILLITLITLYYYSPIPGMKNGDIQAFETKNVSKINEYLNIIPDNASVAASNSIGAHLSHREKIYVVPYGIEIADYVIFYNENANMRSRINNYNYQLLVEDTKNNFYLYKKNAPLSCQNCNP